MPKLTLCLPPARWGDPGPSIPFVVAILPDFDEFLLISSKLDYLYRCNRHPTLKCQNQTLCLPPARWEPRALDSECSGNIGQISMDFFKSRQKLDYLYRFSRNSDTYNVRLNPFVSHLLAEDPRHLIQSAMAILPVFEDFFQFNQNSTIYTDLNRHPTPKCQN